MRGARVLIFAAGGSTSFPLVAAQSRGGPFVVFAAMMALRFAIVFLRLPETRQRSLEAIGTSV